MLNDVTRCHGYTIGITPIKCARRDKCQRYLQLALDKSNEAPGPRLYPVMEYACGPGHDMFISRDIGANV